VCVIGEVADSLDAENLNGHVISCVVLIKQALILAFPVYAIYLSLVESFTQVVYYVLNHHDLQLNLLPYQLNYVSEGPLALLEDTCALYCLITEYEEANEQYFSTALPAELALEDILLKKRVNEVELLEVIDADYLESEYQLAHTVSTTHPAAILRKPGKSSPNHLSQPSLYIGTQLKNPLGTDDLK
jgi:hypothetical protein